MIFEGPFQLNYYILNLDNCWALNSYWIVGAFLYQEFTETIKAQPSQQVLFWCLIHRRRKEYTKIQNQMSAINKQDSQASLRPAEILGCLISDRQMQVRCFKILFYSLKAEQNFPEDKGGGSRKGTAFFLNQHFFLWLHQDWLFSCCDTPFCLIKIILLATICSDTVY